MEKKAKSIAKEFKLTSQNRWKAPTLEQEYWKNPNDQKGCSAYASGMKQESGN